MDTITHAIIGATLARATTSESTSRVSLPVHTRTWIGALAAAFPDIDYVSYPIDPLSYISDWHRAETHSFVMLPLWALLLGFFLAAAIRQRGLWRESVLVCGLGILSHILSDMITSWGTEIFAPLSSYRTSLGTTFIIDPYFTLIILSGLVAAIIRHSRLAAQTGIAVLLAYVGMQALLKQQAHEIAETEMLSHQWQQASISTMPQPFSPFFWKIIISADATYHIAYLDLLADEHKPSVSSDSNWIRNLASHYRPASGLDWQHWWHYGPGDDTETVRTAWLQPTFERYRRFALFPALLSEERDANEQCFRFRDLRFDLPLRKPPFVYGICRYLNNSKSWEVRKMKYVGSE